MAGVCGLGCNIAARSLHSFWLACARHREGLRLSAWAAHAEECRRQLEECGRYEKIICTCAGFACAESVQRVRRLASMALWLYGSTALWLCVALCGCVAVWAVCSLAACVALCGYGSMWLWLYGLHVQPVSKYRTCAGLACAASLRLDLLADGLDLGKLRRQIESNRIWTNLLFGRFWRFGYASASSEHAHCSQEDAHPATPAPLRAQGVPG